jgi:uncharacterized protein (TIGR00369 family)
MDAPPVPAGFARHFRKSPLTDPWEPLYSRRTDKAVILGFHAAENHTNARGFVHGGLITALADNAMGLSCAIALGGEARLVTVNLGIDFLSVAKVGQWIAFDTPFVRPGSTICFAQAFVTADGKPCARANATFRVVPQEKKSSEKQA